MKFLQKDFAMLQQKNKFVRCIMGEIDQVFTAVQDRKGERRGVSFSVPSLG